jgi:lipopolysaccharide biosynthesis glycosyltransferase
MRRKELTFLLYVVRLSGVAHLIFLAETGAVLNITICLASDDRYAEYLGVTITSILRSRTDDETFSLYILDGGISEENRRKILSLKDSGGAEITFIPIDNSLFKGLPVPGSLWSLTIYYRLLIPRLLPEEENVLYLDCDIIVRESLAPLWRLDLGENVVAAVEDLAAPAHIERLRRGGVTLDRYVNSGVLLMNLKKWHTERLTERLFTFMAEHGEVLAYPDQDAINIIFKDSIFFLDRTWNTQVLGEVAEQADCRRKATPQAAILHFLGVKPWLLECLNPFQHVYENFWAVSPWVESYHRFRQARKKMERRNRRRKMFRLRLLGGKEKCITLFGKTLYRKVRL